LIPARALYYDHGISPQYLFTEIAARHLCRYGDTDVFPHLPELAFVADCQKSVVEELAKLDIDSYKPGGAVEALAPKSRYGFRIAHQLSALDNILLLASVIEIGAKIEAKRQPLNMRRAFSYRFSVDEDSGQIFRSDRTFKDWLHRQKATIVQNKKIKTVVTTDLTDFYARINFHRLENLLDEAAPNSGASRFIKKHIKTIRAKQSFGLPVGGSAARMLSELALIDTDQALRDKNLIVTRFVDDVRIFLRANESPYEALGFLAEQLSINEGLSLNAAKTSVSTRAQYIKRLETMISDVEEEAEGVALDSLTSELYHDDDPDPDDLEKLKGVNLVELLKEEIGREPWDMGRIRVIFRALKIVRPSEAIKFLLDRFPELLIFAKDMCLLMEVLATDFPGCFDDLQDDVLDAIVTPPASSVQIIRTWLLEMFVRGIIQISLTQIKKIESLNAIADRRQLLLIRGRCDDKNFFRKQKTAVEQFSDFELPCLVWGASCLPKDEYEKWIDLMKGNFGKPLGGLYIKWLAANKPKLKAKLKGTTIDHPD
jgi:Reverse transcriptase (RNA-dependent DNA polymerase)